MFVRTLVQTFLVSSLLDLESPATRQTVSRERAVDFGGCTLNGGRAAPRGPQGSSPVLTGPEKGHRKRGAHKRLLKGDLEVTVKRLHGWIPFCGSLFSGPAIAVSVKQQSFYLSLSHATQQQKLQSGPDLVL